MFDAIIKDIAARFGLGNNAGPLLQMLLAFITNRDSGGISGFLQLFRNAGLSDVVNSWIGGGANAKPISPAQVQSTLADSGLLSGLASRFGVDGSTVNSALAYVLPLVIGKLTTGGTIPSLLPAEVTKFIGPATGWLSGLRGTAAAGAAAVGETASAGGAGFMKWLPWLIGAAILLWLMSMCGKKQETVKAPPPAPVPAPAPAPAPEPAAPAVPPAAKIYFEVGKAALPKDSGDTLKAIVTFLGANAASKAVISGFHDPAGNKAQNEELAKNRAKAVRDSLKAAGVAEDRIVMQKPAETTGTGDAAEARRVEVSVQQ
ncbi:MAG: DUF937 domain-containing protein [Deltaproteobacteria bacterium]|nr:DUF937 domain-containing protein [Deltaproteobacteria bacterium]